MIKSLLAAVNPIMIICYVFDVILILAAIGLFVWYYIKSSNKNKTDKTTKTFSDDGIEKINDDTYVIASDEDSNKVEEYVQKDNAVEHFVNQITDINEEVNNEMTSNAVVVKHEVEQPVKKIPKKDEIANYVMIGGVKKEKTETEKQTSFNRGSDAFKNATNFLNTIKDEQSVHSTAVKPSEKTTAPAATPAKKTTTTRKKTTTK